MIFARIETFVASVAKSYEHFNISRQNCHVDQGFQNMMNAKFHILQSAGCLPQIRTSAAISLMISAAISGAGARLCAHGLGNRSMLT